MTRNIAAYLDILGLDSCESHKELNDAYRRAMKKWHPDYNPLRQVEATEQTKKINDARDFLAKLLKNGPLISNSQWPKTSYTRRSNRRPSFTPGFPDRNISEVFVESSYIVSIGYNLTKATLYIKFKDSIIYRYLKVPETVFSGFKNAKSKGKYANHFIYHRYKSIRC